MSSAKGSRFERDACRWLSVWWSMSAAASSDDTTAKRDDLFWRTAGSGARATVRGKKGQATAGQYGDICATDPLGQELLDLFMFELKCGYSDNSFQDLLDSKRPDGTFIGKTITKTALTWRNAAKHGKGFPRHWAILWKANHREPLICLPSEYAISPLLKKTCTIMTLSTYGLEYISVLRLADFLSDNNLHYVKQQASVVYNDKQRRS